LLHGESFNFGPAANNNHAVADLVVEMSKHWDLVSWKDISRKAGGSLYEAGLLRLNCDKALSILNWKPTLGFGDTIRMTSNWYRNFYQGDTDMRADTLGQIQEYENKARVLGIDWAQ
jgi:CDP-glucose 4,6-dehydratase